MTPTPNEVREQTAAVRAFLRSACPVCLIAHDAAIHAATLRLRRPLPASLAALSGPLPNAGVAKYRAITHDGPHVSFSKS